MFNIQKRIVPEAQLLTRRYFIRGMVSLLLDGIREDHQEVPEKDRLL